MIALAIARLRSRPSQRLSRVAGVDFHRWQRGTCGGELDIPAIHFRSGSAVRAENEQTLKHSASSDCPDPS